MAYLLGYDVGSSSVKAALVNTDDNTVAVVSYPKTELVIQAPQIGWAEQDPEEWYACMIKATQQLLQESGVQGTEVKSIGISYQMHGLVCVGENDDVLRPSIIWCDSRSVGIGEKAFEALGKTYCLEHLLNSPGNFTASKLKWVQENESELYKKIKWAMLPGDYLILRMSGMASTTVNALSEGMFWDFKKNQLASELLDYYEIDSDLIPPIVENCSVNARLTAVSASELGLSAGTPITYRAGDQPNNALSLGVLQPGECAATGGTSGVVYAVTDQLKADSKSRVNGFAHINHTTTKPRIGNLMCVNGAGILYNWINKNVNPQQLSYSHMEDQLTTIPIGSEGLTILPFGNGAERILENATVGAQFLNLDLNRHSASHIHRAALEGIAFAFAYGLEILKPLSPTFSTIRAGNDNLFQSDVFAQTVSTLSGATIALLETTGARGAAHASGVGIGAYNSIEEAVQQQTILKTIEPADNSAPYQEAYQRWKRILNKHL